MSQKLEYIDSYFQGELNAAEASEFEQSIANDADFAGEVAFYLSSVAVVKGAMATEKKKHFQQLYNESKIGVAGSLPTAQNEEESIAPASEGWFKRTSTPSIRNIWKYTAAAVVVGIVSFAIYFATSTPSPNQMATEYITTELTDLGSLMGTADSMEVGKQYNNDGRFHDALLTFESILSREASNVKAMELAGIAALQLKNYDKALQYFEKLADQEGLRINSGKFYTALTLMKRNQPGDNQRAKETLQMVVRNNLAHSEIAAAWLKNW